MIESFSLSGDDYTNATPSNVNAYMKFLLNPEYV